MAMAKRELMAKRAAQEIEDNSVVNLGIGIPTLVANYVGEKKNVWFHGENGLLGIGTSPNKGNENENNTNAGGFPCTNVQGSSYFDSCTSFAIIRAGLIDLTILGALEVSEKGDLANWIIPGKLTPGIGGGMELAQKAKKVIVLTTHVNKNGVSKIKKLCTLPITALKCVDLIITDLAVMKVRNNRLELVEIFSHTTIEEVLRKTEAELFIPENVGVINYARE
ncbi:3-oxoacid CoA-transferase subunit B [Clostridium vincentii]|uniref:Putative succinyl-CoA:3-ketoacid coenzyme A transferase subunit B n=1 Tax=Clostridium vincentii TaxID=52704 RepID=A0A2T0BIJ0_9CLOT|nr:putative succinyl-CoA:3-ketoacid coenzyme A transferase subunit B [Clostridium vincentii]